MNAEDRKVLAESIRRSPFWVCLIVFALLACERGFQLTAQLNQRRQLQKAVLLQAQNQPELDQARQLEARLEGFSVELVQMSHTNTAAKKIVQDFNIQWTPGPAPGSAVNKASK